MERNKQLVTLVERLPYLVIHEANLVQDKGFLGPLNFPHVIHLTKFTKESDLRLA